MAGTIGEINQGIVGISHTTGNEHAQMPTQKMDKPSPGSNIIIHTRSALVLEDSDDHIMRFIRGEQLDSYSPGEQKELRQSVIGCIQANRENLSETENDLADCLKAAEALLKNDELLESMAVMARNILISA